MKFQQLLDKYRKYSFSERDKGSRFERLMQAYLKTDPQYENIFKSVWLWNEFPYRKDFGGHDTGIDLVALTYSGDYWAIQCKCYQETFFIDKPAVDSFLATSSKIFTNDNLQSVNFAHRLWISTTNKWGSNASEAIQNQHPPVSRLNLCELQQASVDWESLEKGITGELARSAKKELRPHQQEALKDTNNYFKTSDRGKLIMACGTGKTFTSLRIAENETDSKGLILFLVPSIALLGQTLREWSADAKEPINAVCICSDSEVSRKKKKNEDTDSFSVVDLALPASTDVKSIVRQFQQIRTSSKEGMTVVFSTYQSIEVIAKTQQELLKANDGYGIFDLIICDEAHRTTGIALTKEDSSAFIKVHDNDFIKAKKRLYMTATPRLYSDDAKGKAAKDDVILCSMDDTAIYGEEIYRIGFGKAVEYDLLADYKVLVLTLNDNNIPPAIQQMVKDKTNEITTDDASKLIGCINALSKQVLGDAGIIKNSDPEPMKRAVAFCQNIAISKQITDIFNNVGDTYLTSLPQAQKDCMVSVSSQHIDGTMSAPERDALLGWLKEDNDVDNGCRVLTNVRCLSEGVDVPSLDAVMFLSARNSQIDVVQSVGRVMRKSEGKKYGYIIIPVVVPSNVEADKALDDNARYKVVWTVLNALRAHDDRFNATVNKIDLNKNRPESIIVGRVGTSYDGDIATTGTGSDTGASAELYRQMSLQFEQLQDVIYARMVQKVGDRRYWEQWAKNVAEIAERQIERISNLIKEAAHKEVFDNFLKGLQNNINPSITQSDAIEMLSQHIITKPVFDALFEGYSFIHNNPVSVSMQKMLNLLEAQAVEKDTVTLDKFYESVKMRAKDIDNAEGKQRIIIELYDKFFKTAFPKMVEKLGIVYTPVEVVDFIIHSVNDVLQKEFNRSLSDENIKILDPFTGTGTFITRLIQSGLIKNEDLPRKYQHEIYANEIVLLAYYIAAVNIENAYHDAIGNKEYSSFNGICLTDTFQLGETGDDNIFGDIDSLAQNDRVIKQKKAPLRVIIGNPPYSVGQKSANDNAQNQKYEKLHEQIARTYAATTKATNKNSLYDSYIKAFRWSTDRLNQDYGGVIAFVSNGAWLDGNATDGFRKCLEKEFSAIYVFNLRGNQRTSGELSRKEGGKIFGSGSRTPIAITLLVKNPDKAIDKAQIYYHDIGDYLNREEKLAIIKKFGSISNPDMNLKTLNPNADGDWIVERNQQFENYISMGDKSDKTNSNYFNLIYSRGLGTSRDHWAYNFSKQVLKANNMRMINYYNNQVLELQQIKLNNIELDISNYIKSSSTNISWTSDLKKQLIKHNLLKSNLTIRSTLYRPFNKINLFFDKNFIYEFSAVCSKIIPSDKTNNRIICVSGLGGNKDNTTIMTNYLADLNLLDAGTQCFPLYYYEKAEQIEMSLFGGSDQNEYVRRDGISDFILERSHKIYGKGVTKEDIFYYVYGILHNTEYRTTFTNDLKKMLPRIPLVDEPKDFWKFSKAGRALADLHINYESVPAYDGVTVKGADSGFYKVEKMRFPKKDQKDTIIYNSKITVENIPAKAYEYVVNGKSAIEWIMERYQITVHKDSGIRNDPNDWADEVGNPRYILDLLLSIINVSVQTVDIVNELPTLNLSC